MVIENYEEKYMFKDDIFITMVTTKHISWRSKLKLILITTIYYQQPNAQSKYMVGNATRVMYAVSIVKPRNISFERESN